MPPSLLEALGALLAKTVLFVSVPNETGQPQNGLQGIDVSGTRVLEADAGSEMSTLEHCLIMFAIAVMPPSRAITWVGVRRDKNLLDQGHVPTAFLDPQQKPQHHVVMRLRAEVAIRGINFKNSLACE